MPPTRIQQAGKNLGMLFVVGILVFVGLFGFITLFAIFLAHLRLT